MRELGRLLRSAEPEGSTERCWNWRAERLECRRTVDNRRAASFDGTYNGYPVLPGYFGRSAQPNAHARAPTQKLTWAVRAVAERNDALRTCVSTVESPVTRPHAK